MDKNILKYGKLSKEKFIDTLIKKDMEFLISMKEYLDNKYYNSGETSELSDEYYDILKDLISEIDPKTTLKIGSKIREDNNRIVLPVWLGSIDKIKQEDQSKLKNWLDKNTSKEYIIEDKLDGVSCLLTVKNGITSLYTRGDGIVGSDISHLTRFIKNIPKKIKDNIMIRGELLLKKEIFDKKYKKTFANSRNMISGLVNSKSLKNGLEHIDFIAYEIILNEEKYQYSPEEQLQILEKIGFSVVHNQIMDTIDTENLTELLLYSKQQSKYEIDGIIVQSNLKYIRNEKDNPKYAFAFKMTLVDNIINAEVVDVEWNVSKHRLLKPRIKIKPVNLNGVTITYTSGFNAKYIMEKSIGKGTIIKLTRSGDVIPFIVDIISSSKEPLMPDLDCEWNENKVDLVLLDNDDNTADIKMISSFFSSMDIKNLSDKTVEKIYNAGFTTLKSIFKASEKDFEKIDGFGKVLASKIYTNIHNGLQNITKDLILGASGLFGEGIGRRKLKSLFDGFPDILERDMSNKELIEIIITIDGFSNKTAEKIVDKLDNAKKFLKSIDKYVSYEASNDIDSNIFEGKSILFSGFRNKELENDIILNGGKIVTSISKNTSYLIVKNKEENSSKILKAKELRIPIVLEKEFYEHFF
jgi:NAD-dependent DNA ligase